MASDSQDHTDPVTEGKTKEEGKAEKEGKAALVPDIRLLDMRVGRVEDLEPSENDLLYVAVVEIGTSKKPKSKRVPFDLKRLPSESLDTLSSRKVIIGANLFGEQTFDSAETDAKVLCAAKLSKKGKLLKSELLNPPTGAKTGDRVFVPGYKLDAHWVIRKSYFAKIAEDFTVNSERQAVYKGIPLEIEGKGFVTAASFADCPVRYSDHNWKPDTD